MVFTSGARSVAFLVWLGVAAMSVLLPVPAKAVDSQSVATLGGPHTQLRVTEIERRDGAWWVRGRLQLLPDPLPRSRPGRVLLEATVDGRVVAQSEATLYRLVTANRRARQFGYCARLDAGLPAGAALRLRHLPARP